MTSELPYGGWLPPEPPTASPPPEPPQPPEVPLWAPFATLLAALFVVLLFGGALIGVIGATDSNFDAKELPVGLTLGLTAFQDVVLLFAAWITVKLALGRASRADFGLVRVRRFWDAVGWAALVYIGFWVVTVALTQIFSQPEDQELVKDVKAEDSLVVLVSYAVFICLIAPIVEEIFFRGFMFGVLARRLGPWWGMAITGAVFGLIHAPAPAIALIALGAFGVGLCLLYWRTQSIVPCMALHALNNAITFGVVKDLDPALFATVVVASVGGVAVGAQLFSARAAAVAA